MVCGCGSLFQESDTITGPPNRFASLQMERSNAAGGVHLQTDQKTVPESNRPGHYHMGLLVIWGMLRLGAHPESKCARRLHTHMVSGQHSASYRMGSLVPVDTSSA